MVRRKRHATHKRHKRVTSKNNIKYGGAIEKLRQELLKKDDLSRPDGWDDKDDRHLWNLYHNYDVERKPFGMGRDWNRFKIKGGFEQTPQSLKKRKNFLKDIFNRLGREFTPEQLKTIARLKLPSENYEGIKEQTDEIVFRRALMWHLNTEELINILTTPFSDFEKASEQIDAKAVADFTEEVSPDGDSSDFTRSARAAVSGPTNGSGSGGGTKRKSKRRKSKHKKRSNKSTKRKTRRKRR